MQAQLQEEKKLPFSNLKGFSYFKEAEGYSKSNAQ